MRQAPSSSGELGVSLRQCHTGMLEREYHNTHGGEEVHLQMLTNRWRIELIDSYLPFAMIDDIVFVRGGGEAENNNGLLPSEMVILFSCHRPPIHGGMTITPIVALYE